MFMSHLDGGAIGADNPRRRGSAAAAAADRDASSITGSGEPACYPAVALPTRIRRQRIADELTVPGPAVQRDRSDDPREGISGRDRFHLNHPAL